MVQNGKSEDNQLPIVSQSTQVIKSEHGRQLGLLVIADEDSSGWLSWTKRNFLVNKIESNEATRGEARKTSANCENFWKRICSLEY